MDLILPKKIFIVDDDVDMSEMLAEYLKREVDHDVSIYATGEECYKHLVEEPDLIVLDYYLSSAGKNTENGVEILSSIKKHYPDLPVIMVTSQESYSVAIQSMQHGAMEYVIKGNDAFERIDEIIRELQD